MFDSSSTQCRSRAGFSLVEIVIVLLIAGIIAAIAIPNWSSSLEQYQADLTVAKLVADLEFAGTTARVSSSEVTITFFKDGQSNGNRWQFDSVEDPQLPGQLLETNIGAAPYNARLSAAAASITFNIHGVPAHSRTYIFDFGTDRERQVQIQKGTGNITTQ